MKLNKLTSSVRHRSLFYVFLVLFHFSGWSQAGLNYKYYEGTWNSLPDFGTLTPIKTGTSFNVDLSQRTPGRDDNFAFYWYGFITIPTAGSYTFETVSDDGSKIYYNSIYGFNNAALVNNDGLHGTWNLGVGTINIPTAGTYPITITYFEKDGGEAMQVFWTGPNITRAVIPNSAFTTTLSQPPGNGLSNIYELNGNIGIGTSTPQALLDVNGKIYSRSGGIYADNYFGYSGNDIASTIPNGHYWRFINSSTTSSFKVVDGSNNTQFFVDGSGNVGINTNDTKGYKLGVNGAAIFTKVVVKLNNAWPDYVFKRSYGLPSLKQIEDFIATYQHLPDMPSSADVEQNGIDVGGNQALLLRKIEELTLYLIEQNKRLEQLQEQVIELKEWRSKK